MRRPLGIRGRLLLAFVGISGFALLATAAAMYSFLEVRTLIEKVTEQRVPTALGAQQLSVGVGRIVAETPVLLAARDPRERSEIWNRINAEIEKIDGLLNSLGGHGLAPEALVSLQNVLDPLRSNLLVLNTLADERIALADRKAMLLEKMVEDHENTVAVLGPWITKTNNDVQRLRSAVDAAGHSTEARSNAETELIAAFNVLASLQQILVKVGETHENLMGTASAETRKRLDLLTLGTKWSLGSLDALGKAVGTQRRQLVLAEVERFRKLLEGDDDIPALRARELTLIATGEKVRRENTRLSGELTASVDVLVGGTERDIAAATAKAHAVQARSSLVLILIVSLSLASSILIVWRYVDRNIVARLTALNNSMLAIARGDLKAALPPTGRDEIGHMAAALKVFRDTAVEVEEKNLREIAAARQRLIDAIESISEGFSLYDKDDRLVLSNSRYRKLLYAGIEDVVQPGALFATIVRAAAERGLVADAAGRIDEWVAERLARHRSLGEPHLQHRSDGSWILISERRTHDGSTVAVYEDVTELKQREQELAEKSNALEQKSNALQQLSNQLAKYLSPQIYDSIFRGEQEVKVASSRKKLTIFFSDVAGFTETAEKLESEELTQLLNHYLTEMSRIALDYGATIDKYVGDAILIFFGDPETKGVKEDAVACVKMAIAMRRRMRELEDFWRESGIEKPLRMRMGMHTGYCTVGNFGSEDRMDYTIIGGAVNTASRLESSAAVGEILISYETYAHVKDQILCTEHGEIDVKGIAYPVTAYQVVDTYESLGSERHHFSEAHPNMNVDLDLDAMTSADREQAKQVLSRALDALSNIHERSRLGRETEGGAGRERSLRRRGHSGALVRKAR